MKGGGESMKVKSLFFPFPSCDGWFQPKVLSLQVKKISTVILINKCLDLAFATLMVERKKFRLHSEGFFCTVLRRLWQSSCHSWIKKRNSTLGHYFPLFVVVFFNYAGKTGTLAEAGLRITAGKLRMAWMRMPRAWKRKEMGHPVLHTSSAGFSLSSYF